jgi:hypothetical protein
MREQFNLLPSADLFESKDTALEYWYGRYRPTLIGWCLVFCALWGA